jgi:hypothetical protein
LGGGRSAASAAPATKARATGQVACSGNVIRFLL